MQRLNLSSIPEAAEMRCASDYNEEEVEQIVIIELVIPGAYVVPVAQQASSTASALVQPVAISSTVSAASLVQLRANNTALNAAWRTTATLAACPRRTISSY